MPNAVATLLMRLEASDDAPLEAVLRGALQIAKRLGVSVCVAHGEADYHLHPWLTLGDLMEGRLTPVEEGSDGQT